MIGIPIAAAFFYPFFGWLLKPCSPARAMSFSSVSVIAKRAFRFAKSASLTTQRKLSVDIKLVQQK